MMKEMKVILTNFVMILVLEMKMVIFLKNCGIQMLMMLVVGIGRKVSGLIAHVWKQIGGIRVLLKNIKKRKTKSKSLSRLKKRSVQHW